MGHLRLPPDVRFDRLYTPNPSNGCWEWKRPNATGYGYIGINGKNVKASRYAYTRFVGELPDDLTIDHLCRNPRCVNPAHLEAVPMRENILRSEGVTAKQARQTHCKRGHELTPNNIIRYTDPAKASWRECLVCNRERCRQRYARRKARLAGIQSLNTCRAA